VELSINQALLQAVTAHNEGKLENAERLYRAILQVDPSHPDANHNLGLVAVSVDKVRASLPLFKIALESNPKTEQFWVSYIKALIADQQFEKASGVLAEASKSGMDGEQLKTLEEQLASHSQLNGPKPAFQTKQLSFSERRKKLASKKGGKKKFKKPHLVGSGPTDSELNHLMLLYQHGRHNDAEELAFSFTERFPNHQLGWLVLCTILGQAGRCSEAITACQKSVELSPQDAGAHNNLGNTLRDLGRLEDAEESYLKAIALQPNFADAHNNVGTTFKELGRFDEAESMMRQAILLKPEYATAHYNLGIMLQELGRLDEAEASYKQASTIQPFYLEAHSKLLKCLYLLDKKTVFFDQLDFLVEKDIANAVCGSLVCRSILRYGVKKPNLFCRDPLQYVQHSDLKAEYDFEDIFSQSAKKILSKNRLPSRKQPLIEGGYQTYGNIFNLESSLTEQIQRAIRLQIESYLKRFKDSDEGLFKKWPTDYTLYGWLVSMKSGGELHPHIHDEGWLSGSIYISVPQKVNVNSGNLVLSLGEDSDVIDKAKNTKKIVNVFTGSLVLFPASLTHFTIPFEAEDERIVLAFDIRPN
jgi:tetratricopeptide (TPR) repeat protein